MEEQKIKDPKIEAINVDMENIEEPEEPPARSELVLFPKRICQTYAGDLAHTVGRLVFKPKRPMLVEHLGGIYLEHDLFGRVLTPGYGEEYNIVHVWGEEGLSAFRAKAVKLTTPSKTSRSGYSE